MSAPGKATVLISRWPDAWLLDGVRTPFVDFTEAFGLVSPIDLGIKAACGAALRDCRGLYRRRRGHRRSR
jgi:hypothetical protein